MKRALVIMILILVVGGIFWWAYNYRIHSNNDANESSAQQQVVDLFGQPAQFAVTYVAQETDDHSYLARFETWYYPTAGKKITFLGGYISEVIEYDPNEPEAVTTLQPADFDYADTVEDVKTKVGEENLELVDYLPGLYEAGQFESYISDQAVFVFERDHLTYVQTFGSGQENVNAQALLKPVIDVITIPSAEAKIRIKNVFRCLGQVCRFVVELPDRATRWMGPVVGPIVSGIITQNIANHASLSRVFNRADRINKILKDVNEQEKLVKDVRKMYADAATELTERAAQLRQAHQDLLGQLKNREITVKEFRENVVALELMAQQFDQGAEKFRTAGGQITTANIVRMLGRDLLNRVLGQARQIVYNEVGNEIRRLINFDVLDRLIEQSGGGADAVLDLLFSGELEQFLTKNDTKGLDLDALRERIREEIKQMLRDNKKDLQQNWKQRMQEVMNRIIKQLKEERARYQAANQPAADENSAANENAADIPVDEHGCKPGYKYSPQSGISCIQENCSPDKIPSAHWSYEGYCVCGSSGSIAENPDDLNQECSYPNTYAACPGCVYACVGLQDECPAAPENQ